MIAAVTQCKDFNDHINNKKNDVLKLVSDASTKYPSYADYLKSLITTESVDSIDSAIDMHLKCVEILSAMKKLFNDDVIQCGDLLNVLKSALIEMC